jgi:hypothetical protein
MTSQDSDIEDTYEIDSWLTSVFAAAVGPFVDSAFADRILARLRRVERIRMAVIFGTILFGGAITVWQISGLIAPLPSLHLSLFQAPEWLANTRASFAVSGLIAAGFAIWMIAEEA